MNKSADRQNDDRELSRSAAQRLWNRWFGDRGERAAARYLRKRMGYRVVTRGYRTALGEVDLIALDGRVVVFVEVKTRKHGAPAEAVTLEKQRRLTMAATHFLKRHQLEASPSRFDVVAIVWPDASREPVIEHIRNAFPGIGHIRPRI